MSVARVQYAERKTLNTTDLNDEQAYLVQLRRKHWLWAHGWGIVQGLMLAVEEGELILQPGMAVDGYGRELYIPEDLVIPGSIFAQLFSDQTEGTQRVVDFWLRYSRKPVGGQRVGQNNRWAEEAVLCATRVEMNERGAWIKVNPRRPPGVPLDDLARVPGLEPPDDPARAWPVYLGRAKWRNRVNAAPVVTRRVRATYTTLVGERVDSVSRQFIMEDPKKPNPVPPPPVSRAVMDLTASQPGRPAFSIRVADNAGSLVDRLALWRSGAATLRGHAQVLSDLLTNEASLGGILADPQTGRVSQLCLGKRTFRFAPEQIADPQCMLSRLMTGRLPLKAEIQAQVRRLIQQYLDNPEEDLAEFLAIRVLNHLMKHQRSIFNTERLRQVPLRSETWQMIRTWPARADYRPLAWQVLAEALMDAFVPGLAFNAGHSLVVGRLAEAPTAARPWQIYRLEQEDEEGDISSQLQFEIADPGDKDEPALYQLAIGRTKPQPKPVQAQGGAEADEEANEGPLFSPCLVIDANCNVTVKGTLLVHGRLVRSPVQADPDDPRFVGQMVQGWMQGAAAAELAATALDTTEPSITARHSELQWRYTFTVTNKSMVEINQIDVIDTYAIDGARSQTTIVARIEQLAIGASQELTITHAEKDPLPSGKKIGLSVAVQGQGPGGMVVFSNTGKEDNITQKDEGPG